MIIGAFLIVALFVNFFIPFKEERDYIKMEMQRSYEEDEYRYWRRELKYLYLRSIPLIGRFFRQLICNTGQRLKIKFQPSLGWEVFLPPLSKHTTCFVHYIYSNGVFVLFSTSVLNGLYVLKEDNIIFFALQGNLLSCATVWQLSIIPHNQN